mmetsp:Transcript_12683/g.17991  ORF Transcript_12683/g.17991 Transcript_12683/m.17991 type:complete len:82 (-) Transcript_12683:114-359(-)
MSEDNGKAPEPTWKLPDGIEDHIEAGLIQSAVGVVAGGITGALLFRSGKGMAAAGMATGFGIAVGSTFERAYQDHLKQQKA